MVSSLGGSLEESIRVLDSGRPPDPDPTPVETSVRPCPPAFLARVDLDPDPALNRTSALALHALAEALASSGLDTSTLDPLRVGVCMGTTVGCSFGSESYWDDYRRGTDPGLGAVDRFLGNDLSTLLASRTGAAGPTMTVVNACASATDALGLSMSWIQGGLCDVVIAGGSDELKRFSYHGFLSLKNMSFSRCKPFDRGRDGLNLGEGAGVVVLESESHAAARGAPVLGVVEGYGAAGDAHHATSPHPEGRGLRQAIAVALESAGLEAGDIGLINGHGTATLDNDRVEGMVLADMFPESTIVSTKE